MNENWKFSDIPYHRPDVEALQARYDALTRRARAAACPEDLLDVVRQRDALQQEVALCQSIATIRAFHDVTDEFYQRELQETLPRLETLDTQSLSMAIAESPYAAAVDGTFGPQKQITRAEAVTMVNRTLDRHPDQDHFLEDMLVWPDNLDTEAWYYADIQEATNSHDFVTKDRVYESWTDLNRAPDWSRYE